MHFLNNEHSRTKMHLKLFRHTNIIFPFLFKSETLVVKNVWTIENFHGSFTKPGDFRRSPVFSVAGNDWCMLLRQRDDTYMDFEVETSGAETPPTQEWKLLRRNAKNEGRHLVFFLCWAAARAGRNSD